MQFFFLSLLVSVISISTMKVSYVSDGTLNNEEVTTRIDTVGLALDIEFPAQAFPKKVIAFLTPKIGSKEFHTICLQGSKTKSNYQTISYKYGATLNYKDMIPYFEKNLDPADLKIDITLMKGGKLLEKNTFNPNNSPTYLMNNGSILMNIKVSDLIKL